MADSLFNLDYATWKNIKVNNLYVYGNFIGVTGQFVGPLGPTGGIGPIGPIGPTGFVPNSIYTNLNISGSTGTQSTLPSRVLWANVNSDGTVGGSSNGFSGINYTGGGSYLFTYLNAFNHNPSIKVTINNNNTSVIYIPTVFSSTTSACQILIMSSNVSSPSFSPNSANFCIQITGI